MSIAETVTKLPLATWAKILGIHPLHFEGVAFTPNSRQSLCDAALPQFPWQEADRTSREDIARAIAQAEEILERQLGWRLMPSWESDEWHSNGRPWRPEMWQWTGGDIRGYPTVAKASWGKLISGGIQGKTLIQAGSAIVWSDADADDYKETGTITVPVAAGVDACEVEVYYPGHLGEDAYQIRPIQVSIALGVATIRVRRELCILETILNSLDWAAADGTDDTDFLTTVDVYRRYNDPSTQATLMWEPVGCSLCGATGCAACSYSTQTGCLHLRSDPMNAMVAWTPGTWNASTNSFDSAALGASRAPDLVRLYYYAGHRGKSGCAREMDLIWAQAVTYLSLTLLDRPLCDCTDNVFSYWRDDLGLLSGGDGNSIYGDSVRRLAASSPFGTRRGAYWAWQRVNDPDISSVMTGMLL